MTMMSPPGWRGDIHVCELPRTFLAWRALTCDECGTNWAFHPDKAWIQMGYGQPRASAVIVDKRRRIRRRKVQIR